MFLSNNPFRSEGLVYLPLYVVRFGVNARPGSPSSVGWERDTLLMCFPLILGSLTSSVSFFKLLASSFYCLLFPRFTVLCSGTSSKLGKEDMRLYIVTLLI